jgi:hypothetical protein
MLSTSFYKASITLTTKSGNDTSKKKEEKKVIYQYPR